MRPDHGRTAAFVIVCLASLFSLLILSPGLAVPAEPASPAGGEPVLTAGPFTNIGASLPGVYGSALAWGDYDNDGRLDVLVTGATGTYPGFSPITRLYHGNSNGTFTDIGAGLPAVYIGALAWGDYDNDGRLDVLLAGATGSYPDFAPIARIYHNNGNGSFSDIGAGLPGVYGGALAWGDYDNDGRLDVLLTGASGADPDFAPLARIYHNDGNGSFSDSGAGLPGVYGSAIAWGDYDNDGRLDILLAGATGTTSDFAPIARIYHNDGNGTFTDSSAGLPGVYVGSLAWGDYDNDGRLDVLLAGAAGPYSNFAPIARIYRNDGNGSFTDIAAGLAGVYAGTLGWGDYDNDGRLDVLLTGATGPYTSFAPIARVYRSNGSGSFTDIAAGLPAVYAGSAAWGDYDNDGRLDVLMSGATGNYPFFFPTARIYRTAVATANALPSAPAGLNAAVTGTHVTLSWSAASDGQTPSAGLSYNVVITGSTGATFAWAPMADPAVGWRRLPALGNAQQRLAATLTITTPVAYTWSVQAIDGAWAGGPYAAPGSFTIGAPTPTATATASATSTATSSATATATPSASATATPSATATATASATGTTTETGTPTKRPTRTTTFTITATATRTPKDTRTATATATATRTPKNTRTDTATATSTATSTPTPYTRFVNCGGPGYTSPLNGRGWKADKALSPGTWGYLGPAGAIYTTTAPISGTLDDVLYQSERNGMAGYAFSVPNGTYSVTLKFAEIRYNAAGKRSFDVQIESQTVLAGFDIWVAAGNTRYKVVDRSISRTVSDGVLNIDFLPVIGAPKISAISVIQQ